MDELREALDRPLQTKIAPTCKFVANRIERLFGLCRPFFQRITRPDASWRRFAGHA